MAYVNRTKTGTVTGSHVLVKRLNGIGPGEFSEFLIHVVCARTRVVTNPDAKVLGLQGALLVDL